jgi:hypothetical protein
MQLTTLLLISTGLVFQAIHAAPMVTLFSKVKNLVKVSPPKGKGKPSICIFKRNGVTLHRRSKRCPDGDGKPPARGPVHSEDTTTPPATPPTVARPLPNQDGFESLSSMDRTVRNLPAGPTPSPSRNAGDYHAGDYHETSTINQDGFESPSPQAPRGDPPRLQRSARPSSPQADLSSPVAAPNFHFPSPNGALDNVARDLSVQLDLEDYKSNQIQSHRPPRASE